jgi:N-dimethylarginine dimethylaminohydrolase
MVSNKVYRTSEIDFSLQDTAVMPLPRKVLMCRPTYFEVIDVKNVHMESQTGKVDKHAAMQEWEGLKSAYEELVKTQLLDNVWVIEGAPGCEDMVFAANQSFPWLTEEGRKVVVMSKMFHESRKREVPYFEDFYKVQGYEIIHLHKTSNFEGMGDTIPHPGKRLLYGGYGHRSTQNAYEELTTVLKVPVVALQLPDPRFYHLDTCFVPLDENEVMLCREAFTEEGLSAISKLFEKVHIIPVDEASAYFSLNAHVLHDDATNRKVAFLHPGSKETVKLLRSLQFEVHEISTHEFMKSGGSVFCMKMMMF